MTILQLALIHYRLIITKTIILRTWLFNYLPISRIISAYHSSALEYEIVCQQNHPQKHKVVIFSIFSDIEMGNSKVYFCYRCIHTLLISNIHEFPTDHISEVIYQNIGDIARKYKTDIYRRQQPISNKSDIAHIFVI